jgi:hypothetical protein
MLRLLTKIPGTIPRLRQEHWLSFRYDLDELPVPRRTGKDTLLIRLAGDEDVRLIEDGAARAEPIVSSSLRFWKEYGFRQLYLGFVEGDPAPCIFQYMLDDSNNHRYARMDYGGMYRQQQPDEVQAENIFAFPDRRRRGLALDFERELFALLKGMGKRTVRTHISIRNKPALIWARTVGFRPERWITMVTLDLPVMRNLKKEFVHRPIREAEYGAHPLSLFKP